MLAQLRGFCASVREIATVLIMSKTYVTYP